MIVNVWLLEFNRIPKIHGTSFDDQYGEILFCQSSKGFFPRHFGIELCNDRSSHSISDGYLDPMIISTIDKYLIFKCLYSIDYDCY